MSIRGVPQLRQLIIRYSDRDGSSRGIREYIGSKLREFAEKHSHVTIRTELKRNVHPFVRGEYASGAPKTVCVRNEDVSGVEKVVISLRDTTGRKVKPLNKPVISRLQSIQGPWTPQIPLHNMEFKLKHEA